MTSQHLVPSTPHHTPPPNAATRCRFKAAARLAHANISYGGEEQTAAAAAAQRKLCSAVISSRSDAACPAGPLIWLQTIRESLLLCFQPCTGPFICREMDSYRFDECLYGRGRREGGRGRKERAGGASLWRRIRTQRTKFYLICEFRKKMIYHFLLFWELVWVFFVVFFFISASCCVRIKTPRINQSRFKHKGPL